MSDAESIYTFAFGLVIFLIFWFLLNRARAMRAKGRDLMASGQKDLASGRKKIQDGRKSVFTGTLLLIRRQPPGDRDHLGSCARLRRRFRLTKRWLS